MANKALSTQVAPADVERLEADVRRRLGRARIYNSISTIAYPLGTVVVLLIVWQLAVGILNVPTFLLPAPTDIALAFVEFGEEIGANIGVTAFETFAGFGLSVIIGIPLGLALALSKVFSRSFYPLLVGGNALPKVAVAPLFIVWFGFGLLPKVLVAFLTAFFPVMINTVIGVLSVEPEKIHLARSMGLSRTATFFKVQLPQALPVIFAGLKVASSLAVIGAVVGEFVGADSGLAKLLLDANANLQTPLMFAVLIVLTVFSVLLFGLVQLVERLMIPWHQSVRNGPLSVAQS